MNWIHGVIGAVVIVTVIVGGYMLLEPVVLDTDPAPDMNETDTSDDADGPTVSGAITRHTPDYVSPGSRLPVTVQLNVSPTSTVTVHERIRHADATWHNVTVRNADAETVRYYVDIPADTDGEVTISGHVTPSGITGASDDTVTVRRTGDTYWDPDYIDIIPALPADHQLTSMEETRDTDNLDHNVVGRLDAEYTGPEETVDVTLKTFNTTEAAEVHLADVRDRYDGNDDTDDIIFERNGQRYRAWTVDNLYVEMTEQDAVVEAFQTAIEEARDTR